MVRNSNDEVYAQHCWGRELENLAPSFFFHNQAVEAITVSESKYQKNQAHKFQLCSQISSVILKYYAYDGSNLPMPVVMLKVLGN